MCKKKTNTGGDVEDAAPVDQVFYNYISWNDTVKVN